MPQAVIDLKPIAALDWLGGRCQSGSMDENSVIAVKLCNLTRLGAESEGWTSTRSSDTTGGAHGAARAAFHGHVDVVNALLKRGARVDVIDKTWGTPPTPPQPYHEMVARLVAAGANVRPDLLDWDKVRADPKMRAALMGINAE